MRRMAVVLAMVLVTLASVPVAAQPAQTGTLSGVITDPQGGVLPGVTVVATSEERGFTRQAVTDAQGRYRFPSISIGSYTVTARLSGFAEAVRPHNLVETEKTTNVTFGLKLEGQSESLEVVGEAPIVDDERVRQHPRAS